MRWNTHNALFQSKGIAMQLINETTRQPLKTGEIVQDFRGERWVLEGGREPHKPSSTGFVWVRSLDGRGLSREFYPSVIGAKWEA